MGPVFQVIVTSLLVGVVSGWLMHRADFCTVAALRDQFLFKDSSMFRAQMLLVALSAIWVELLRLTGVQAYSALPFYGQPSLSNLVGGVVFGFGMVLAGGCVVGVLYRLGSGSRIALVALAGLICGSALYAEIHPWWKSLAAFMQLGDQSSLPLLTHIPSPFWALAMLPLVFWLWRGLKRQARESGAVLRGFVSPCHAALGLSLCGVASLVLVGMPLGVTTSYAKWAASLEGLFLPGHVQSLEFFSRQPFVYTPPYSGMQIPGGAGGAFDAMALIQYPLIMGVVGGAGFSSWRIGEFRLRFSPPRLQVLVAFVGGVIMGIGSRLTPGCNVWHLWGGLPHLALSSLLFFFGLLPGAWLGSRLIQKVVFSSQLESAP